MKYTLFFLEILLFIVLACKPPATSSLVQDSYTVSPTKGQRGSISFSFAGNTAGSDNYIIYYSTKILEDPLVASIEDVANTQIPIEDKQLRTTIDGLQEGEQYYIWVYARRGSDIIAKLPIQTVHAYTVIKNYQVISNKGVPEATWAAVRGAESFSLFKEEASPTSPLMTNIQGESASLGELGFNNQEKSYVIAYDADGDTLAQSDTVVYDITLSLTLNIEDGIFPYSSKLTWRKDELAETYEITSNEVDSSNNVIPSTQQVISINASTLTSGSDAGAVQESYLIQNLDINKKYLYQILGKTSTGKDSQRSGKVYGAPKGILNLSPYANLPSSTPYQMNVSWVREFSGSRDFNGDPLASLYDDVKYKLTLKRPSTAPGVGTSIATSVVYSDAADDLAYTNSTYNIALNDGIVVPVYIRDSGGIRTDDYTVTLELVGKDKTSKAEVKLGSYTNKIRPTPVTILSLNSQFDGVDAVILYAPTATSSTKNYYRIQKDLGYDDIPSSTSALTLLPADNTLDFTSASLSSLAGETNLQYEVWTTHNDLYVSVGIGSTSVETSDDLRLSAVPGQLPGSLHLSWNASYDRDMSGYTLERKRTDTPAGPTAWDTIADISYGTTSYTFYDMNIIDETRGNARVNYDVRLTPKTLTEDVAQVYSAFPANQLLLETPTQVTTTEDYTPFQIQIRDQQIALGVTSAIGDLTNPDGSTFLSHFVGTLAPTVRLIIERPSIRPTGVAESFTWEMPFAPGNHTQEFNDTDNTTYRDVTSGRVYSSFYTVKYQLVGQNEDGEEQLLGESDELPNVRGGYLSPAFFGGGDDDINLNSDDDAKFARREFLLKPENVGKNFQIMYIVSAAGHSTIPEIPSSLVLAGSPNIHGLGAGSGGSYVGSSDLRNETGVTDYYAQIYTYRTVDRKLIGAKLITYPATNVLQPMFYYTPTTYQGATPIKHWFTPYMVDTETNDIYYFNDDTDRTPATAGFGTIPIGRFSYFKFKVNLNIPFYAAISTYEVRSPSATGGMAPLIDFFSRLNSGNPNFDSATDPEMTLLDSSESIQFGKKIISSSASSATLAPQASQPTTYDYTAY